MVLLQEAWAMPQTWKVLEKVLTGGLLAVCREEFKRKLKLKGRVSLFKQRK